MSIERIDACYDSHVHWAATGEFSERLRLESLGRASEVLSLSKANLVERDEWILGFGWDQTHWPDADQIHRRLLDQWISDKPVLFTRIDGHVGWANTAALKAVGGLQDDSTGILGDKEYEAFLRKIPKVKASDLRRHLLKAARTFHREGFTHIRDVGGSLECWEQALLLDRTNVLKLAVEMFFHVEDLEDLNEYLSFVEAAKHEPTQNLRAGGIKIFADGALGSEGAWVSKPYRSGSGHGLQLLANEQIHHVLKSAWKKKVDVAVHTIGDESVHQVVCVADRLRKEGIVGRLHLEHAEIVRPETIDMMKELDVICHLQPCHWLSDHRWLKDKVGEQLYFWSFPWRRFQQENIEFDFGSDSPIEPPSVARTLQALAESSQAGIGKLLGLPERFMSHPDRSFSPNSFSIFENGRPVQVVFQGDHLI